MSLDRRSLLITAAAAGLISARPAGAAKSSGAAAALPAPRVEIPPGDAAINRYFDGVAEHILTTTPEQATSLGLDTGARTALKSQLSDASMAHITEDRAWCNAGSGRDAG